MDDKIELLLCPFCNSEAHYYIQPWGHTEKYVVGCSKCKVSFWFHEKLEEAINKWNKRTVKNITMDETDELISKVKDDMCKLSYLGITKVFEKLPTISLKALLKCINDILNQRES